MLGPGCRRRALLGPLLLYLLNPPEAEEEARNLPYLLLLYCIPGGGKERCGCSVLGQHVEIPREA